MAHAPGWIELYGLLEEHEEPPAALVDLCKAGRTKHTLETMLHWYVIEGQPAVIERLIDLGFDVDAVDAGGSSPLYSAAILKRWEMIRTLRRAGAKVRGVNTVGKSYRSMLCEAGPELPADLRADRYELEDLLLPGGPEKERVTDLYLTRSGLPATALGQALHRDSWARFARQDAELGPEFDDSMVPIGDGNHGYCTLLEAHDSWMRIPGIQVSGPSTRGLRAAYRIAQHFGARVIWAFECAPEPNLPAP